MTTPIEPVTVHIASANEGVFPGTQAKRRHIHSVYRTFPVTTTPIPILAEDRSRIATWMVAYGNSVVLCDSESQAQAQANQVANAALGAAFANTPGNPEGTLLFVPVLIGPPVNSSPSVRWTLNTTEVMWAVSMAPALLAVTIENKAEGY